MIVSAIAALGLNGELGFQNKLLWHLPDDFKFFKEKTLGHILIMGRKTYDSIGRPLPGRTTFLLSRSMRSEEKNIQCFSDLESALSAARKNKAQEVFICGGGEIYEQSKTYWDRIYLTRVEYQGKADVFFPQFAQEQFEKKILAVHPQDERHAYAFCIEEWIRLETIS